jgi:hypothetical protein
MKTMAILLGMGRRVVCNIGTVVSEKPVPFSQSEKRC